MWGGRDRSWRCFCFFGCAAFASTSPKASLPFLFRLELDSLGHDAYARPNDGYGRSSGDGYMRQGGDGYGRQGAGYGRQNDYARQGHDYGRVADVRPGFETYGRSFDASWSDN